MAGLSGPAPRKYPPGSLRKDCCAGPKMRSMRSAAQQGLQPRGDHRERWSAALWPLQLPGGRLPRWAFHHRATRRDDVTMVPPRCFIGFCFILYVASLMLWGVNQIKSKLERSPSCPHLQFLNIVQVPNIVIKQFI